MTAVNRVAQAEDHTCKGGAVHRCIRPLASRPLLRPGHDEIRAHRSQINTSGRGPFSLKGLTTRRSTVSSSLSANLAICRPGDYAKVGSRRS